MSTRVCVSCGAARTGDYCTDCGQRELSGRHTLRSMMAGALGRVLNLEKGFVHTAWRLTVAPGVVVRDYLAGRTTPYTHPAGYLLVSFAAFALQTELLGGTGATGSGNRIFIALVIPIVAGVSRLLFWRARLNYAEHLILAMYLFSHVALTLAVLFLAAPLAGEAAAALAIGALGLGVGYFAWGYSRFFERRPLLAAAGGLAALAGGVALWTLTLATLLNTLRT